MTVDEEEREIKIEDDVDGVEEEDCSADSSIISVHILSFLKDLHQKHGLRHNDYQRYRGYCSRRLLRLRQALKLVQGEKKKFIKKEVDLEILKTDKHLMIPLMSAERGWAYAMGLKFQLNTEPRKKYHMINRLRKAKVYSDQLLYLAMNCPSVDARTKLECQAYGAWMTGNLLFETSDWKDAMDSFNQARSIYEKLSVTLGEEEGALYKSKMDELVPNLRYCAYNIGDTSAKKDLMNLRGTKGNNNVDLEDLINQTREQQAATLQEVEWRDRKMAVKQEKVRIFLLRNQEFDEELKSLESSEEKISAYESLMMDCKDAIQVLRDDLVEDPNFRNRQQVKEGSVTASHFLYTYLNFIKYNKVIERNLVMIEAMKAVLNGQVQVAQGRKPVKCQDLVRIYENIISNLGELPLLAGLEEDLAFRQGIDSQIGFYKGLRCYYIAQSFLGAQKWPEAMALFQRSTAYANKARNDSDLDQNYKKEAEDLLKAIEGRQFMAHANSILDNESVADKMDKMTLNTLSSKVLMDRLDTYFEDDKLIKNPKLAHFPPQFEAIPCKPLFFDLALEHVEFPSLESKLASPSSPQKQGGQSGWLGGWLGGWGGKK